MGPCVGPGRGEGEADPQWDLQYGGAQAVRGGLSGLPLLLPLTYPSRWLQAPEVMAGVLGGGEGMTDPGIGDWWRRGQSRPTVGLGGGGIPV